MTEYRNFWVRIEHRADGLYVRANSTAGGTVSAPLELPDDLDAYTLSALLRGGVGPARGAHRDLVLDDGGAPAPTDDVVGQVLFDALFPGPVRDAFMRSSGSGRENGVRVRIQIDPTDPTLAELAGLPWELLHNGRALGRSRFTPIVRSFDVAQPYLALPFVPPLRVLLVLANPAGTDELGLDREKERITEILGALDGVEVTVLEHATEKGLFDALDVGGYHVLHYMGHGGFDAARGGVLFLEDGAGRAAPLPARLLGDDLAERRSMRLVFLNACDTGRTSHEAGQDPFTGVASALVAAGIPAVIAMQVPVADRAAFAFAEKVYSMIAHGSPVDAAVAVGRRAIFRTDETSLEWATPVLFMRSEDGHLFNAPTAVPDPPRRGPDPPRPDPRRPDPRRSKERSKQTSGPSRPTRPARPERTAKRPSVWLWIGLGFVGLIGLALMVEVVAYGLDGGVMSDGAREIVEHYDDPDDPSPGMAFVAEHLVAERADLEQEQFDLDFQEILSLSPGGGQRRTVSLEPGFDYRVLGSCDADCASLYLGLYNSSGVLVASDESYGDTPVLHVSGLTVPEPLDVEVGLADCSTPQCFVGLSVYRRPAGS